MVKKYFYTFFNPKKNLRIFRVYRENNHFGNGVKRVYHHHLMKTGGTSLNNMFLNLSHNQKDREADLYSKLMSQIDLRLFHNNWVFTAWNQLSLSSGLWHYGWSHRPIYKTILPNGTFTITTLRDPRQRVFSRYKQLIKYYNDGNPIRNHPKEFGW
ncbi:hypothetical protein SAMN06265219_12134 [Gracilimonas mengyeensis]|uniref:Sulfotransferase family protein n=1 Tax=Gracilimonas mengyeensis TaxID=1302730 RepID=A0A521FKM6_9BACT|nr:hypothetical protein SAMN06265219_12134 [Gracilimonas mengyeensis]